MQIVFVAELNLHCACSQLPQIRVGTCNINSDDIEIINSNLQNDTRRCNRIVHHSSATGERWDRSITPRGDVRMPAAPGTPRLPAAAGHPAADGDGGGAAKGSERG